MAEEVELRERPHQQQPDLQPTREQYMPSKPHTPRVSVVIPAWNRRDTLRMSVESVLRQTFTDFELIVVDDGSTDGTMEAIADIADPRIRRLAHETNKGVSAARNTGIRAARGEWVAFQDSDDEWLPLKLEKQMARLEGVGSETVACYTGMINIEYSTELGERTSIRYFPDPTRTIVDGDIRNSILEPMLVFTPTVIIRQRSLLSVGGFDEAIVASEDWDCFITLAQLGKFLFVDDPFVKRYLSGNSISYDLNKMLEGEAAVLRKHYTEILAEKPHVLVHHYIAYAGIKRRRGELVKARESLAAAAQLRPFSLPIRLRQLRLLGTELRQRLWQ